MANVNTVAISGNVTRDAEEGRAVAREAFGRGDGVLACGAVCCAWHGSQFNVNDGPVRAGPAEKPIATYRLEESGETVRLVLPAEPSAIRK